MLVLLLYSTGPWNHLQLNHHHEIIGRVTLLQNILPAARTAVVDAYPSGPNRTNNTRSTHPPPPPSIHPSHTKAVQTRSVNNHQSILYHQVQSSSRPVKCQSSSIHMSWRPLPSLMPAPHCGLTVFLVSAAN
jgi:hypothetical protein